MEWTMGWAPRDVRERDCSGFGLRSGPLAFVDYKSGEMAGNLAGASEDEGGRHIVLDIS